MASRPPGLASDSTARFVRMCGGCTTLVANEMVLSTAGTWPISPSSYVLDNACGPALITTEIKRRYSQTKVLATDPSPTVVEEAQRRIQQSGWQDVQADQQDVRNLDHIPNDVITHAFTSFGIFVPGDEAWAAVKALKEIYRVLRPGGVTVISHWADFTWPVAFINTAKVVRPDDGAMRSMGISEIYTRGSWLVSQFEQAGFGNNVDLKQYVAYMTAQSLDDLVNELVLPKNIFFRGFSEKELERAREVLKEEIQEIQTFENVKGGSVKVGMKAWIAYGKKGDR